METTRISTKEIIAILAEKFPACFTIQGPAKPLKIGIFQDLAVALEGDEKISKTRLRQALRHYTSSWRYLKSVKVDAKRVDINGEEVEVINAEQAEFAAAQLKESQEKFANKKSQDESEKSSYKDKKASAKSDAPKRAKPKTQHLSSKKGKKPANKPKQPVKLVQLDSNQLVVGMAVKVQFGNSPMDAVITEISGDDVSVQLSSGMVVKTQAAKIFTV